MQKDEHADFMDAINGISESVDISEAVRDVGDMTTVAINNLTRAVLVLAKITLHQAHVGVVPYYE